MQLVTYILVGITTLSLLLHSGCGHRRIDYAEQQAKFESEMLAKTEGWPEINKTETEIRVFLDNKSTTLNPIEGIWTLQVNRTWRNIISGITNSVPELHPYRIAIVRDEDVTDYENYDFVCFILESEYSHWPPGRVKALFRKTAYDFMYEGLWYMGDYTKETRNYAIDEFGLMKHTSTYPDRENPYIEWKQEVTFLKAYPAITGVTRTAQSEQPIGHGSGFLIAKSGLIVTNYHVVEDALKIEVVFPIQKASWTASIRIKDAKNDIAILELKDFPYTDITSHDIPYSFATSSSAKVGQEVYTLGFPLGDIMGTKARLSTGRINSDFGIQDDPRLYQISNPLQPGNSGGPLFNLRGELVGIVVSGLNAKYFYENIGIIPQNVNFAVKATYLQNLISMLPESHNILNRANAIVQAPLENQVEQLNPFIVQINVY